LRDLFGLTPAETRLAALLISGIGLPDASIQLGIKRETGRSQLKSIFTKTSTGTQAQLAHLLTRLGSLQAIEAPGGLRGNQPSSRSAV
jgi:DNA-binding CsgD family transcriptional regulator